MKGLRYSVSEKAKTRLTYILSAIVPVLIICISYSFDNGLPFTGQRSILLIDMNQQYVDFYTMFRNTIIHGQWSNFFFSFSNGMGSDMWGIWAYYLMSPFNALFLLFKTSVMPSAIFVVMLAKYAAGAMSMTCLLRHYRYDNRWIVILSIAYTLCGWSVAYQSDLMWLDALTLLPLLILGIELIFETSSLSLYTGITALCIIDNYYMGYMMILFSIIFFIYRWITHKYLSKRLRWSVLKDYILSSLVSIVMSVWFWVPTVLQLLSSKTTYRKTFNFNWTADFTKSMLKTFSSAYSYDELKTGGANMYITLFLLVIAVFYFFNRHFLLRERIGAFLILALLYVSTWDYGFMLAWHGFQDPIWYPYRFSYIISFWLILLAARQLYDEPRISVQKWAMGSIGVIFYCGVGEWLINAQNVQYSHLIDIVISGMIALIGLFVIMAKRLDDITNGRFITLLILIAFDMGFNYHSMVNAVIPLQESTYQTAMSQLYKMKAYDPDTSNQYRSTFLRYRSKNDSLHIGMHSLSEFSSTTDATSSKFVASVGVTGSPVSYDYSNGSLITDALFGMHSIMNINTDPNKISTIPLPHRFDLGSYPKKKFGEVSRYTNNQALPVAYATSYSILKNWISFPGVFNHQIAWLNAVAPGKDITTRFERLHPVRTVKRGYQYLTYTYKGLPGSVNYVEVPTTFNGGHVSLKGEYDWRNNGQVSYIPNTSSQNLIISVDNKETNKIVVKSKHTQELNYDTLKLHSISPKLLQQRLQPVVNENKNVRISYPDDGKAVIDIDVKKGQLIATSLAYNPNYYILDNGKEIKGDMYNGSMLALQVKPGHHRIVIRYQVKGMSLAFIISAFGGLLWLSWVFYDRRKYM